MRVTRRYWELIALVALLAVAAVVLAQPVLLFGVALVGGWIVTLQMHFLLDLRSVTTGLVVEQTKDRKRVLSGESTELTLRGALVRPSSLEVQIRGGLPPVASPSEPPVVTIEPGRVEASDEFDVEWDVAGTYTLKPARVRAVDAFGLFSTEIDRGTTTTVTVEPSGPRSLGLENLQEAIRRVFGEHQAHPLNTGLEPEDVRRYVPGDPLRKIDWKATARLELTHVRTFGSQIDRTAVLVIDNRTQMAQGREGETKLDYARHLALVLVEGARARHDPIGFYAIDETSITQRHAPTATNRGYAEIRAGLWNLGVTQADRERSRVRGSRERRRRSIAHLRDEDSAFARTFTTLASSRESEPRRHTEKPLLSAVTDEVNDIKGSTQIVLMTDDSDPDGLLEAVVTARRGDNRVLVVLMPTVLFDPSASVDLEDAYEQYERFEAFRRSLDELDRVEALELAPEERISRVMVAGRHQKRRVRS